MNKKFLSILVVLAMVVSLVALPGNTAKGAIITIAEARSKPLGTNVDVQGNVTVVPGTYDNGFAIQDSTGGIYVYPSQQLTGISLGDVVEVQGSLKDYNGLLEISPVTSINKISSGTCPAPKILTLDQVNESNEGLLVQVSGTVKSISGTTSKTIVITDGNNDAEIYIPSNTNIDTSNLSVGSSITVIGFLGQYKTAYEVKPRFQSDISTATVQGKVQVVSVNPSKDATNVPLNVQIQVTFSTGIDASTLNTSTFTLRDANGNSISGSVSYDASKKTATLVPSSPLQPNTTYTVTLAGSIKDTTGNQLGSDYSWNFKTVSIAVSYTVTFNYNYPDAKEPYRTVTVNANMSVGSNMPENPSRTGYVFKGWNTKPDGSGSVFTSDSVVTSNITVYAQWSVRQFTLTVSATSGGSISPSGTITVNYGDSKTFTITPDKGYKISDVKVDSVSVGAVSTYTFTNITSDHKIEAIFEKNEIVIILQIGKTIFTVNGVTQNLDSPPIIKNGRTLLPIRAIVEALGGTVSWDPSSKKVTVSLGSNTIELWIGKPTAKVNGTDTPIDSSNSKVVPEIINSRTMLPLRFVAESLGCQVQWDGTTQTITVTYGG